MDSRKVIRIARKLVAARFFGRRTPVAVGWTLTDRCNLDCAYCRFGKSPRPELDTDAVLSVLDQMPRAGVELVSFTGGEPLLRADIGAVLSRARELGLTVKLNTNGRLVPKRPDVLRHVHAVQISLDGDRDVHDEVRGEGSFDAVVAATRTLRDARVPFSFLCTITRVNVAHLPEVERIVRGLGATVSYQPALATTLGRFEPNPIAAEPAEYAAAIAGVLERGRVADSPILNAPRTLRHLGAWPDDTEIPCAAGIVACRIETDGEMTLCGRDAAGVQSANVMTHGFRGAFDRLNPAPCKQCWCAANVELNYLYALYPDVGRWSLRFRR